MQDVSKEFIVIKKTWDVKDTFVLQLKPVNDPIPDFKLGQFVTITNPKYRKPEEKYSFQITSPENDSYFKIRIEVQDDWTRYTSKIVKGDKLLIF